MPLRALILTAALLALATCSDSPTNSNTHDMAVSPDAASVVAVDRFSASAGNLFVRTASNGLPAANEPVDFDQAPFVTRGLGPDGRAVEYYNFDVMPSQPAPIYVLFRQDDSTPVPGQLNIIDVLPGDAGYSDFWQVMAVTVPTDYATNTVTSRAQIESMGYPVASTTQLVNCPVVPDGSTASRRYGAGESASLMSGWYRGEVVKYFTFEEKALMAAAGHTPVSPIWVTFAVNPDAGDPMSGPASGFVVEPGSQQTHNVIATLPEDGAYSPLWSVNPYSNLDFGLVRDAATAMRSEVLASGVALVNCPVIHAGPAPQPAYRDIGVADAQRLLERGGDVVVIDVSPYFDQGHLPGAVNLPLGGGVLNAAIPSFDRGDQFLVYCHADGPAIAGAQMLIDAGVSTVYRLVGNYAAWVAAGYAVEQ